MAACLQAIVRLCGATALPPKTGAQSGGCQAGGVTVQHKTPAFNTFITLSEAAPLVSLTQGDNSFEVFRVFNGRKSLNPLPLTPHPYLSPFTHNPSPITFTQKNLPLLRFPIIFLFFVNCII